MNRSSFFRARFHVIGAQKEIAGATSLTLVEPWMPFDELPGR
jgi:hypothetical protein